MPSKIASPSQIFLLFLLSFPLLFFPANSNSSDVRRNQFYKTPHINQFLSLGGRYDSDQNSKSYNLSANYEYKNNKMMSEIDFLHQVTYKESAKKGEYKDEELYDLEASCKKMIADTNHYFNLYNRSQYDRFSDYNFDMLNMAGLGRRFLNKNIEFDINLGYWNSGDSSDQLVFGPSLRINFDISDKITLISKGYVLYGPYNSDLEELKSRLLFRLDEKIWLELIHLYQKTYYVNSKNIAVNNVGRTYTFRIRYNF